jgi:uncharacterized damage-inducible protein DinB
MTSSDTGSSETGSERFAAERADFIGVLDKHRSFLRHTVEGLTDDQARLRPTASALCLGGIIKHVTRVEERWMRFIDEGASAMAFDESSYQSHQESFQMLPEETVAGLLADYDTAARRTDERISTLESFDSSHPLPEAPWFEPGGRWSARRVLAHILAETSQHAGHADIIRETIDGAKTMG